MLSVNEALWLKESGCRLLEDATQVFPCRPSSVFLELSDGSTRKLASPVADCGQSGDCSKTGHAENPPLVAPTDLVFSCGRGDELIDLARVNLFR